MGEVKRTILKALAGEAREQRRVQRAPCHGPRLARDHEPRLHAGLRHQLHLRDAPAQPRLLRRRGDLTPRVKRATLRAAVLGCATAVTMHGSAIFLPHWMRHTWL